MLVLHHNFLDNPPNFESLLSDLESSNLFQDMCIVNKETPLSSDKKGSFVGVPDQHGGLPYLRCPSFFESIEMPIWLKSLIIDKINSSFQIESNSIKMQRYVLGKSGIGPHSDKLLDLVPGKSIFIYRINKDDKPRSLCFKSKVTDEEFAVKLRSNDLLEIKWTENQKYLHYVPVFEDEDTSSDCISFVVREAHTFMDPVTKFKYGRSAKFQTFEERNSHPEIEPIDMRDPRILEHIVNMYSFENSNDMSQNSYDYSKIIEMTV